MRTWRVGALPEGPSFRQGGVVRAAGEFGFTDYQGNNVSLGQGIEAIQDIATDSNLFNNLPVVGQVAVLSGMRAINQLAAGDPVGALTTSAAAILSGTAFYTAKAISEGAVSTAALTVSDLASGLGALVPLFGVWLDAMVNFSGSATANSPEEIEQNCKRGYMTVRWGTAQDGKILPTDIFMSPQVSADAYPGGPYPTQLYLESGQHGAYDNTGDGLRQPPGYGAPVGPDATMSNYGMTFAGLLAALDSAPVLHGNQKQIWPREGLTAAEKSAAKKLRLAMSACYARPNHVRNYMLKSGIDGPFSATAEKTDGGFALWPVYASIFTAAWLDGRLPNSYVLYTISDEAGLNGAGRLVDAYQLLLGGKNRSAAQYDPDGTKLLPAISLARSAWMNESDTGKTIPCPILEQRVVKQFYAMVVGWDQYVNGVYIDIPGGQASGNPIHGLPPGGILNLPPGLFRPQPSWWDVASTALFFAALGAGAYAVVDPKGALRTAKSLPQLARRLPQQAARGAQGAGRWALGNARSAARGLTSGLRGGSGGDGRG